MTYTEGIKSIYQKLYAAYGPQGWWPLTAAQDKSHVEPLRQRGYHPQDYTRPNGMDRQGQWEICMGAILTQNTSWTQVEKALAGLNELKLLDSDHLLLTDADILKEAIKPSGYFNQKAKKIMVFSTYFNNLHGGIPAREDLLALWGIGPETADSILLYAFHVPVFVVDAYTRRIIGRIFYSHPPVNLENYHDLQQVFHTTFPATSQELEKDNGVIFKEYHALLVEHAKTRCQKKPLCTGCPLTSLCDYARVHNFYDTQNL